MHAKHVFFPCIIDSVGAMPTASFAYLSALSNKAAGSNNTARCWTARDWRANVVCSVLGWQARHLLTTRAKAAGRHH